MVFAVGGIGWVCAEHGCVKNMAESESYGRVAVLVTFGGLLLGLPIPSPGRRDG